MKNKLEKKEQKKDFFAIFLFCALFAIIEAISTLSISVSEAMFLSKLGVEEVPLSYILSFFVMSLTIALVSFFQSKYALSKVINVFFSIGFIFITLICSFFTFFEASQEIEKVLLFAVKLASFVWMYTSFTLFWNFTDEYFSIRQAKKTYAIFSAFGCLGAIIGGLSVYLFSEKLQMSTSVLLWVWAIGILLCIPLFKKISKVKTKIETGIDFELSNANMGKMIFSNLKLMWKSKYVKYVFLMYVAVMFATSINEYVYFSSFTDYANELASLENAKENASELWLASTFGILTIAVNVLNLVINLFIFNKLVSRFGVANLALLQSILFIASFVWLINSFGIAAGIFGFFVCRGFLESVDANNENLMISVMPSKIKNNARLLIEVFIVPLSAALAGVFLMLYSATNAKELIEESFFEKVSSIFHLNTLNITQIAIFGLFVSFIGLIYAYLSKRKYPEVLEKNLKENELDFSKSFKNISNSHLNSLNNDEEKIKEFFSKIQSLDDYIYALETYKYTKPNLVLNQILSKLSEFNKNHIKQLKAIASEILKNKNFENSKEILTWILENKQNVFNEQKEIFLDIFDSEILEENGFTQLLKSEHFDKNQTNNSSKNLDFLNNLYEKSKIDFIELEELLIAKFKFESQENQIKILDILFKLQPENLLQKLLFGIENISSNIQKIILEKLKNSKSKLVYDLLEILEKPDFSCPAKALACRALKMLFPSQLEMLSEDLIQNHIKKSFEYLISSKFFYKKIIEENAVCILLENKSKQALDFALLVASITNKIPSYEIISFLIFSNDQKNKDNALENIEQCLDKAYFDKISTLVENKSQNHLLLFYKNTYEAFAKTKDDILNELTTSPLDTDFLASLSIFIKQKSTNLEKLFCLKIGNLEPCTLKTNLLETLDLIAFSKIENKAANLFNSLPCIFACLSACKYFEGFETACIFELSLIASSKLNQKKNSKFTLKENSLILYSKDNCVVEEQLVKKDEPFLCQAENFIALKEQDILNISKKYYFSANQIYIKNQSK